MRWCCAALRLGCSPYALIASLSAFVSWVDACPGIIAFSCSPRWRDTPACGRTTILHAPKAINRLRRRSSRRSKNASSDMARFADTSVRTSRPAPALQCGVERVVCNETVTLKTLIHVQQLESKFCLSEVAKCSSLIHIQEHPMRTVGQMTRIKIGK